MNVNVLTFPSNSSCINYVRYPVNTFSISLDKLSFMEIIHDNDLDHCGIQERFTSHLKYMCLVEILRIFQKEDIFGQESIVQVKLYN